MIVLESEGLMFKNNVIPVFVHALICDSPARAFVTSVKGHNAYHGCHKCVTKGVYSFTVVGKQGGRVTFPELNAVLRDDQSFHSRLLPDHHNLKIERSDIERLKMNFVKNIPLDYMHLVCLGVEKKNYSKVDFWKTRPY
ncbi:Uncharacterized protein APZ42_008501 [Daphnia magna]|uniref:Uncharacterized protein n=1 Tax=Daphnia magna TaxID=35525 RepID=A0A162D0C7_9CRUS|nr:Uncharacterized protein APZ42_008501 [Daphnia magna]